MEMNVEKANLMRISAEPSPIYIMIRQEELQNVEYCIYLGSMMSNSTCTRKITIRIAMTKVDFNRKKTFHPQTGLKFKEETSEVLHLEHSIL